MTDVPWAMVFPGAGPGPRHPSQLYEALLEGLVLFAVMAWLARGPREPGAEGRLMGAFLIGYGIARGVAEQFREPDVHLGFLLGGLTMGQLLSLPMIVAGLALVAWSYRGARRSSLSGLDAILADEIRARGPLSVARFMELALGHPTLGYYQRQDPLGVAVDFVTAPETSQMFGEIVGLWLAQAWSDLGRPAPLRLVELGPGRGTLIADLLRATARVEGFRAALSVHLVERSARLRRLQAERLVGVDAAWHDELDQVPPGPLLLVANEFLDALPVHQLVRTGRAWVERRIALTDERRLVFVLDERPSPLAGQVPHATRPRGTVAEVGPARAALARRSRRGSPPRAGSRCSSTTAPGPSARPATPCRRCAATPPAIRSPAPARPTSRPRSTSARSPRPRAAAAPRSTARCRRARSCARSASRRARSGCWSGRARSSAASCARPAAPHRPGRDGRTLQGPRARRSRPPAAGLRRADPRASSRRAMLQAANLAELDRVRHGFFTRAGGVSEGDFAALNCGYSGGDDPLRVERNRALALAGLGAAPASLCTVRQVHGAAVVVARAAAPGRPTRRADALVTDRPGLTLGVLSADCAPVLLADRAAGVIGAAHAGWRGALDGVVEATVLAMAELGARPERIRAAVGPCIALASYEVGPDLRQPVVAEDPASAALFPAGRRRSPAVRPQGLRAAPPRAGRRRRARRAGRGHLRGRGALLQRAAHAPPRRRALRPNAVGDHARRLRAVSGLPKRARGTTLP